MLVLTRHVGEEIVIDTTTRVTVVAIKGDKVRLGVTAPTSIRVDRREVYERRQGADPPTPACSLPPASEEEDAGKTAQRGDHVQVHFVKRFQDGSAVSSRDGAPLELTVGVDHQRLPGLGMALVGLVPGSSARVSVPAGRAYPLPDPARVHRWARTRFPEYQPLRTGEWVRTLDHNGRSRLVRILEVCSQTVVVDTNHRRAGQALELEVELVRIRVPDVGPDGPGP